MLNTPDWKKVIRAMGLLTQLGLVIAANLAAGFFLGYFLDNIFGLEMVFKLIGLLLGVVTGIYANYRLIKNIFEDDNSK